jgi:FkbM family methyltransferase
MADCDPDISALLPFIDGRACIVQAGGNVGVYPSALARSFLKVVTAEPDHANYECLRRNLEGNVRIRHLNCAFGETAGSCEPVHLDETNCGAHLVEFGTGEVPVIRIDDLKLEACDAIWLDIEGSELLALKGAEATIERFSPVISVEDKGLNQAFGIADGELQEWLAERKYMQVGAHGRDKIFKRHLGD